MDDLIESLTRGNPTEVKVLLATVVTALALYQAVLIAVAYGRLRPPVPQARPASRAHRAIGDALLVLIVVVAVMCLAEYGWEDGGLHAVAGAVLLGALALKVLAVRRGGGPGRLLPLIGTAVLALIALTWLASAGDFLADA